MASPPLLGVIAGAITMGYAVGGLFFLRFWRETRDRLFAAFAASFWLLGLQRLVLATLSEPRAETITRLYLVRLAAFLILLVAIIDKNRAARPADPSKVVQLRSRGRYRSASTPR
jgi:hypothetical protein